MGSGGMWKAKTNANKFIWYFGVFLGQFLRILAHKLDSTWHPKTRLFEDTGPDGKPYHVMLSSGPYVISYGKNSRSRARSLLGFHDAAFRRMKRRRQ